MGLSNDLSCEAGSFSCCCLTPKGFSISGLRLYFPGLEPWVLGCSVCFAPPPVLVVYLCADVGPPCGVCQLQLACPVPQSTSLLGPPAASVHQLPPCRESSQPSCLSLPLLPVWINVSSLSPWLSDFQTIRFSSNFGCFLFLNCCCPCFGCARRHSVSTYTSILGGSPIYLFLVGTFESQLCNTELSIIITMVNIRPSSIYYLLGESFNLLTNFSLISLSFLPPETTFLLSVSRSLTLFTFFFRFHI